MPKRSQALLELEEKSFGYEGSMLLVCKNDNAMKPEAKKTDTPCTRAYISSIPESGVLGRVKNFLAEMSEANKKLQLDAVDKAGDYNIEALTGNESEYIEMDLMLGVADLNTPEAVAAAESAIAGYQPILSLESHDSGLHSEDSSDEDDSDDSGDDDSGNGNSSSTKFHSEPLEDNCACDVSERCRSKKRPKIVDLSYFPQVGGGHET